jgi:hypothetical protein
MTDKNTPMGTASKRINELAGYLGIDADDADTLVSDIIPLLSRKLALFSRGPHQDTPLENRIQSIMRDELPKVLSNYALDDLMANKNVMLFLIKNLAPELSDLRAKQLVDQNVSQADQSLADQLAYHLGVRAEQLQHFKEKVIPRLKKYTKAMYRKKGQEKESIVDSTAYSQFIIDNVFIDEFENHPYIRSVTDKDNRAILQPEAKEIAVQMISAWKNEVVAKKNQH